MEVNPVYRKLQEHIDEMPVGFPATESGVEIRILQHLFSPEEAAIALHLSALPENLETIHRRARKDGLDQQTLRQTLNRLAAKGAIHKGRKDGKPAYSKVMLAIGMFEFQVDRLTEEFYADVKEYMDGEFGEAFHTTKTSQLRTIPIREEILPERPVGTYDEARSLVRESEGPFAVINCVCRQGTDLQEEPCQQTDIRETCLVLSDAAKGFIKSKKGRELSREEMIELLDRADQEGMVLQPQNTQDPNFICCCCGCCCGVLASAKKLPNPADYFDSNYLAVVDPDLCVECDTCGDRCQMDAITYQDGVAFVEASSCIGCGLCVTTCPSEALSMRVRETTKVPPSSQTDLYKKILIERFGPLGAAKFVGKRVLGMKI